MKTRTSIYHSIFAFAYVLLMAVLFTGCADWDDDGVDFRNYLRDKHPYSVIKEVELNTLFGYQVNDTINNEVWIYTSHRSKNSVRGVLVNCHEKREKNSYIIILIDTNMKPVQCKNCKHFIRDIFYKSEGICSNDSRYTKEHHVCNLLDTNKEFLQTDHDQLICSNCKLPFTKEELQIKEHCFNCGREFAN